MANDEKKNRFEDRWKKKKKKEKKKETRRLGENESLFE